MAFTTVTGSNGVTSLVGTSGVDVATIVTLSGKVFIGGQGSNDVINVNIATGNDVVTDYNVNGGSGDDSIIVLDAVLNSVINGDGGTGIGGNDTIDFGAAIVANSAVNGGSGNDRIGTVEFLSLSNSTINGNAGDDRIETNSVSASFIYGGQDTDTIVLGFNAGETLVSSLVNGNKGSDTITIGVDLASTSGSTLYGGNGNDTINASAITTNTSGITISGDLGDDTLVGGGGIDTILGGEGSDALAGGRRGDSLTGGAGADVFGYLNTFDGNTNLGIVTSTVSGNTGFDIITDFAAAAPTAANGDRFDVSAPKAITSTLTFTSDAGAAADLAALLTAQVGANQLANNGVSLVTITAGANNAGIAGNYVIIDAGIGTAGYNAATDAVIKINTLSGITADQFV